MDWEIKLDDRGYHLRHCGRPGTRPLDFSTGDLLPMQCRKCDILASKDLLDQLSFLRSLDRLRTGRLDYSFSDSFYSPIKLSKL